MQPEIRYCRSADGARIAYTVYGRGEPPLVIFPGWAITIRMETQFDEGVEFYERLSEQRMVVRYDPRGIGDSSQDVLDYAQEAHALDAQAVIEALGLEEYDILGIAYGSPISLLHAHLHAQSVRRIALWAPYSSGDFLPRETVRAVRDLYQANWPLATGTLVDTIGISDGETRRRYAHLLERSIDPKVAAAYAESALEQDVAPILEEIQQPVLLLHRRGNRHIPVSVVRELASRLPNARFVELEGKTEPWIFDHADYLTRLTDFLDEGTVRESVTATPTPFRTVLFTDMVGHTEMMARLGDDRGRQVLREHERLTRESLKEHGGTEVKTMGDGFMASFASVTAALECAIALQKALAKHNESADEPLNVRIGLNAGEPIAEDDPGGRGDLFGTAVNMAARVAAKADGGETLVSNVVRELVAGKGFLFADRGEFVAKGFENPVRLYEVSWRESN